MASGTLMISDPGDLLGAAISGLLVLLSVGLLGGLWNSRLPQPRGRQYWIVAGVACASAFLAALVSYICNVRWS